MGVSKNNGTPKPSILYNRVFHYKPSILGYPYFWKHPHDLLLCPSFEPNELGHGGIIDKTKRHVCTPQLEPKRPFSPLPHPVKTKVSVFC